MDKIIENTLSKEIKRQNDNIELIASENFVSKSILKLQGSIFTNKYAEGYPNRRYYGGCENVDIIEQCAIDYAKKIFNCSYANVQPHSGSSANLIVYKALLNQGDKILSMNLSDGGHLSHGSPVNFSGKEYKIISYKVNTDDELIDYDALEELAIKEKPKLIIAGASAYSRIIDFEKIKKIANINNSIFMVDMAHIAGLIATNLHPSPFPYADVVTSTTHKTLRGPRGGFILTNNFEISKKIDKTVFPGIQGGPLMHVIAAKTQCLYEALQPSFKDYQIQVLKNAKALSNIFMNNNIKVISNGTDNHQLTIDVNKSFNMTGAAAEKKLELINITVNKNSIPNDPYSPKETSGIRIGTPAMTTRGLKEKDFEKIGEIIINLLSNKKDINELKKEVKKIIKKCKKV